MVKKKQGAGGRVFDVINYSIMIILTFVFMYPFWAQIVMSFSSPDNMSYLGQYFWPQKLSIESYKAVFSFRMIPVGYINTITRTVIGIPLNILFTFFGAFFLSKKHLPLRGFFTGVIVFTMFFNGGLIPSYLLVKNLGLLDSRMALILPSLTSAWWLIIARNFIMTIPDSLEEAAIIDGATPPLILFRIIIPLSAPIMAVIALWSGVMHWNAWFDSLIYISSNNKQVLQVILRDLLRANDPQTLIAMSEMGIEGFVVSQSLADSIKAGALMVSIGPIIILYPFLQKYFVKGLLVGSLKG